jgi:hypothetical protein
VDCPGSKIYMFTTKQDAFSSTLSLSLSDVTARKMCRSLCTEALPTMLAKNPHHDISNVPNKIQSGAFTVKSNCKNLRPCSTVQAVFLERTADRRKYIYSNSPQISLCKKNSLSHQNTGICMEY